MKKIVALFSFLFFLTASAFCADRILSFDFGLATGIPFYGDESVKKIHDSIDDDSGKRVVAGATTDLNIKVVEYLTCFVGSDLLSDFNWNGDAYFNHLDLAIFPGVKIYPGIGGLNISFAYVFGKRFDFSSFQRQIEVITESEDSDYIVSSIDVYDYAAWGNGIRLGVEYNLSYGGSSRFLPSLGAYWRWIPRGNYHNDNIICVYALVNF